MFIKSRRTQEERRATTRTALVAAARAIFVEKGYAQASTPDVAAAAQVTRGALYHYFSDKQALLWAVVEHEHAEVRKAIDEAAPSNAAPRQAIIVGSLAYLDAMAVFGRTRLLLVEGPAVFGHAAMANLDAAHAAGSLQDGLRAVLGDTPAISALSDLLSAAFDHAALAIGEGADAEVYRTAMLTLIERVIGEK